MNFKDQSDGKHGPLSWQKKKKKKKKKKKTDMMVKVGPVKFSF